MDALLALDQGTTSSRALLFDRSGRVLGSAQREFAQHFPRPGWVEHDAEEILQSQVAVAREVLRTTGLSAANVAAIGIANQRETTVVWERKTGRPIHPAIVWQDRRTTDRCARLRSEGHEDAVRALTGLLIDPYFSATKIAWILDHVPGARARAERGELAFGTVDSWLVWNLTGGRRHVTDPSNASRTLLFDLETGDWCDELLGLFGVPRPLLPDIVASDADRGPSLPELLGGAIRITGIAGDQQAALFGQACFEPGHVKCTYGTGCFLLMQTGDGPVRSRHGLVTTVAWRLRDRTSYALEGSVFVAGAAVQWLRDGLGIIERASDIEALARSVPDAGGIVFVPAFVGLGAPHWDPEARGTILGITRGTTRAHLARAVLDSIALQTYDVLGAMQADSGREPVELRVDGGASKNGLLLQIQADLIGRPVVRPAVAETTARGAALLAGLGAGLFSAVAEIAELWSEEARFAPSGEPDAIARTVATWRRAVERSRGWAAVP